MLLKSALKPLAVFSLPVVLCKSACSPVAVFWSPVVLLERAYCSMGRVADAERYY